MSTNRRSFYAPARTARWTILLAVTFIALAGAGSGLFRTANAAGPWFVDPAGSNANSCLAAGAGSACLTIQGAIDKASAGDTINVAAGTYTEDLTINKQVDLVGAGSGTTKIKGINKTATGLFPLVAPNIDIQANGVKIHEFTIESPVVSTTHYSSGIVLVGTNIEIHNNAFVVSAGTEGSVAIQTLSGVWDATADISGLNIHDNTFTSLIPADGFGYEGIFINPQGAAAAVSPSNPVVITNNTFSGRLYRGVATARAYTTIDGNVISTNFAAALGFPVGITVFGDTQPVSNALVLDNTITSAGGTAFDTAIKIGRGIAVTNTQVSGNIVAGAGTGILVENGVTGITVNRNSLVGNTTIGLSNPFAGTLDATCNWWGSATGPGLVASGSGDKVSTNVNFTAWLSSSNLAGACSSGPGSWFVSTAGNNANTCLAAGAGSACLTIQAAINKASAGDTINVGAGTYTEDLTIAKQIDLIGAGSSSTIIKGVATGASAGFPGAPANISIQGANGVKIHGFTIESPAVGTGNYSNGIILWGTNIQIYSNAFVVSAGTPGSVGIQTTNMDGIADYSGLNIHDNTFTSGALTGFGYEGIFINPQGAAVSTSNPVVIANNTFSGALYRAIASARPYTTISGNTITTSLGLNPGNATFGDVPMGIAVGWAALTNVSILGNTINSTGGGQFENGIIIGAGGVGMAANVSGNTVAGTNLNGILVKGGVTGVTVNRNSLVGNTTGVANTFAGSLDATCNWWGAADGPGPVGASATGDDVSANVDFTPWLLSSNLATANCATQQTFAPDGTTHLFCFFYDGVTTTASTGFASLFATGINAVSVLQMPAGNWLSWFRPSPTAPNPDFVISTNAVICVAGTGSSVFAP